MGMDMKVFEDVDFDFRVIFVFPAKNGGGKGDENDVLFRYRLI